jgi:hypothetical protein
MSWEQLLDIGREAVALRQADESRPPQSCPNDGEPLKRGPNGILRCPSDGWTASS